MWQENGTGIQKKKLVSVFNISNVAEVPYPAVTVQNGAIIQSEDDFHITCTSEIWGKGKNLL